MILFHTQNSLYQIDQDNKRFRRVSGVNPPLEIMPPDLIWCPYRELVCLRVGACAVIVLDDTEYVRTSTVTAIEELRRSRSERMANQELGRLGLVA